jgi:hypothetical protein
MLGHAWTLQMEVPLVGSISWTILSMPPRTLNCSETEAVLVARLETGEVRGEEYHLP